MNEFNILIGKYVVEADKDLFFGFKPYTKQESESVITYQQDVKYPQLLKDLGIFKSTSEARKNGWDKEVPGGWTDITIGKLKKRICILKRTKPDPITVWLLDRINELKRTNDCKCLGELEEKLNKYWLEQEQGYGN